MFLRECAGSGNMAADMHRQTDDDNEAGNLSTMLLWQAAHLVHVVKVRHEPITMGRPVERMAMQSLFTRGIGLAFT